MISQRLAGELMNLEMDEAMPLTRACGHYLNLSAIAELHHGWVAAPRVDQRLHLAGVPAQTYAPRNMRCG